MSRLRYSELSLQGYLQDGLLNSTDAKLLFKFRTRMVNVGCNYRHGCEDVPQCPLCQDAPDKQEHLLWCTALHTEPLSVINYLDIFLHNSDSMRNALKALKDAFLRREVFLGEQLKVESLIEE